MIIKRFVQVSALLSISSVLCVAAPSADARPSVDIAARGQASAARQESTDNNQEEVARQGLPGRRISGGTRTDGIFLDGSESLAALTAPGSLTVTTAAYPEMLFHVPEMKTDNSAEFVILNADGAVVYEQQFVAERQSELIRVSTEATEGSSPLSLNEDYEWYFSLIPNAEDRSHDVVVHGLIRRVDADEWLSQQQVDTQVNERIAAAKPLAQAQLLYKEANLWHDAALLLDKLHQAAPSDEEIGYAWNQLLEAAELGNINQPSFMVSTN
ncbi:MAG: DUF928 domain-containing protein [Cyanobacteria bacterium P01_D01_bin.105]